MKRYFLMLFIIIVTSHLLAAHVIVNSETENEIILTYTLPDYQLDTLRIDGETAYRISGDFATHLIKESYPLLPQHSEVIGIPIDGDISFEILGKKQKTIKGIIIAPCDKITNIERSDADYPTIEYSVVKDNDAYKRSELYPSALVVKGNSAFLGNRRFCGISINPFQVRAKSKELVVTTEIKIRVRILGNKEKANMRSLVASIADVSSGTFFLNDRTSRYWRKPKEPTENSINYAKDNLVREIHFVINKEGIYRVTYKDIVDSLEAYYKKDPFTMGFAWNGIDPRYLELSDQNGTIPIYIHGESDGHFDPEDYMEFYADIHHGKTCYYDNYTMENVLTLKITDHYGARLAEENGGLQVADDPYLIKPTYYQTTEHYETQYSANRLSSHREIDYNREDLLFWKQINAPKLDVTNINVDYPSSSNYGTYYKLKVALFGSTYRATNNNPDHHAIVMMNNNLIDEESWYNQNEKMFENTADIPNSYLHNGSNQVYVLLPGDTQTGAGEQVLLDYIELTYWREYKAKDNYLKFKREQDKPYGVYQYELSNFTTNKVSIYKIGSSIIQNYQYIAADEYGNGPYTIVFQDSVVSDDINYIAVTDSMKLKVKVIKPVHPSNLHDASNSYNYVIITKHEFSSDEGTLRLKQLWEQRGYSVKIVDTQQIYNEFSGGIKSPQAIKDFLRYAYNNWTGVPLENVLLLGDGVFDKHNLANVEKYDIVPVAEVWTYNYGATSSDNWYGCIVGDDPVADINIGRICVWQKSQILPLAEKINRYLNETNDTNNWRSKVVLASGGKVEDTSDTFAQQSEKIRHYTIPSEYLAKRVYTSVRTVPNVYLGNTYTLKNDINEGAYLVQFMGHGGGRIWSDYNLFNSNDVQTLSNTNYPIVVSMSCYGSAFDMEMNNCIGEALVMNPEKGGIVHFGFTGFGFLWEDYDFSNFLLSSIYNDKLPTIGSAVTYTKARFYAYNQFYVGPSLCTSGTIIGDPSIPIILPSIGKKLEFVDSTHVIEKGDTLHVQATLENEYTQGMLYLCDNYEIQKNIPIPEVIINGKYESKRYIVPQNSANVFTGELKLLCSSNQSSAIATTKYSVGQSTIWDVCTLPERPSIQDSIAIQAKVFSQVAISSVYCYIDNVNATNAFTDTLVMRYDHGISCYRTIRTLPPNEAGNLIYYHIEATDVNGDVVSTGYLSNMIQVLGPDLYIPDIQIVEYNGHLALKVLVQNIGTSVSPISSLTITTPTSSTTEIILKKQSVNPLEFNTSRWEYVQLDSIPKTNVIIAFINRHGEDFSELGIENNEKSIILYDNYVIAGIAPNTLTSRDLNVKAEIPQNYLSFNSVFYLQKTDPKSAVNQSGLVPIKLKYDDAIEQVDCYNVGCLNQSVYDDTTGIVDSDKKITLTFYYANEDKTRTKKKTLSICRWLEGYNKWIYVGGVEYSIDNSVVVTIDKIGIYALFDKTDSEAPNVEFAVENQEFYDYAYITKNSSLSILLSDSNGIDIFDRKYQVYINDNLVEQDKIIQSTSHTDLNYLPIKFPINDVKGEYKLDVKFYDLCGNFKQGETHYKVGGVFDLIRIANYPNPIITNTIDRKNSGRTWFTYTLTGDADEVNIKIYTVSGRLIKSFSGLPTTIGYHEYPRTLYGWDCRDDDGYDLANGTYFYKVIAKKGNKNVEKTSKLVILK